MVNLKDILEDVKYKNIINNNNNSIKGLSLDSRTCKEGYVFFAIEGASDDGNKYIKDAIDRGANVVVTSKLLDNYDSKTTYVIVENVASAVSTFAKKFYDNPSSKINIIGVTGTNGKTTTATLLYRLFKKLGYKCGLISTIRYIIDDEEIKAKHTTPDQIKLNELLSMMIQKGCEYCFMEVSSHAMVQQRVEGIEFKIGIFTNITHDHLDYHGNFRNYIDAKKMFFDKLSVNSIAVINKDDKHSDYMVQNCKGKILSYSIDRMSDYKGKIIENSIYGLKMMIDNKELDFLLTGRFNASNIMAVYVTAIQLHNDKDNVLREMTTLLPVEGRFDVVKSNFSNVISIVDYAHTPDALEKLLQNIVELKVENSKIITVFGCGGNRDKLKRPIMGSIAYNYSDIIIITSDNPRNEDPESIIKDIADGIKDRKKDVIMIPDRREAIKVATVMAKGNDIIVVAGKGHENYQEINGVRTEFDDKKILKEYLIK